MGWLNNFFHTSNTSDNKGGSQPAMEIIPKITLLEADMEMEAGAPEPILLQGNGVIVLVFRKHFSGQEPLSLADEEHYCVIFEGVHDGKLGSPNDEALGGHPLYKFGLKWYSFHSVEPSPWVNELMIRNRVHHRHIDDLFTNLKHYIITFKDETFEVICHSYRQEVIKGFSRAQIIVQKSALVI